MRIRATHFLVALLLVASAAALAAEGGPRLLNAPTEPWFGREASLQRGARDFVNYCLNCHTAQYMRYARLTDLGLTDGTTGEVFATGLSPTR